MDISTRYGIFLIGRVWLGSRMATLCSCKHCRCMQETCQIMEHRSFYKYLRMVYILLVLQTPVCFCAKGDLQLKEDECFSIFIHATVDSADLQWHMSSSLVYSETSRPMKLKVNNDFQLAFFYMLLTFIHS